MLDRVVGRGRGLVVGWPGDGGGGRRAGGGHDLLAAGGRVLVSLPRTMTGIGVGRAAAIAEQIERKSINLPAEVSWKYINNIEQPAVSV